MGMVEVAQGDKGVDNDSPWAVTCRNTFLEVSDGPRFVWKGPRADSAPPTMGRLPGHVRPLDSPDLHLEQFSEDLARFHKDYYYYHYHYHCYYY